MQRFLIRRNMTGFLQAVDQTEKRAVRDRPDSWDQRAVPGSVVEGHLLCGSIRYQAQIGLELGQVVTWRKG
jgi:hypothetical protein